MQKEDTAQASPGHLKAVFQTFQPAVRNIEQEAFACTSPGQRIGLHHDSPDQVTPPPAPRHQGRKQQLRIAARQLDPAPREAQKCRRAFAEMANIGQIDTVDTGG